MEGVKDEFSTRMGRIECRAVRARSQHRARRRGAAELSAGDTAWMLTSSALVLMMTIPGLALFYGGLVRGRNVLSVLMQCLVAAWTDERDLGPGRLQPGVQRRWDLRRRLRQGGSGRNRTRDALGDDPRVRLRGVPGHVRDHHARADAGRIRRAHALQRLSGLHHPLGAVRLRPAGPHGLGRRADLRLGRARFRGRPGRAHVQRLLGAGRGHLPGQAQGLRHSAVAAAQSAVHGDRCRAAVGGLVRLQRR